MEAVMEVDVQHPPTGTTPSSSPSENNVAIFIENRSRSSTALGFGPLRNVNDNAQVKTSLTKSVGASPSGVNVAPDPVAPEPLRTESPADCCLNSPGTRIRPGAPVEAVENARKRKMVEPKQKSTVPKFQQKRETVETWLQKTKTDVKSDSSRSNQSRSVREDSRSSGQMEPVSPSRTKSTTPTQSIFSPNTTTSTLNCGTPKALSTQGVNNNNNNNASKQTDAVLSARIQDLQDTIQRMDVELLQAQHKSNTYKRVVEELMVEITRTTRREKTAERWQNRQRLGQFKTVREGSKFVERWQDGQELQDLSAQFARINMQKEECTKMMNDLRKKKASKENKKSSTDPDSNNSDDVFLRPDSTRDFYRDIYEQEEVLKQRRDMLRKEETELLAQRDQIEKERNVYIRELRRAKDEEASRFRQFSKCNDRFLMLALLGKGGFSEVWKAYDLDENRYVACKVHHVGVEWREDKKANYVKHALREKDIHVTLNHPRIVSYYDMFVIDNNSFCTVLEYCNGRDLDVYLKQHSVLAEKEARCIIMQVVSGLKYLNDRPQPIIHYDLKPANILLQEGVQACEIKITDFGLSKMVEKSDDTSIELTSQGAGTYWYLPPETFAGQPKISSKVDVWSVGVIFYQCLYGRRPFGHNESQQEILNRGLILDAKKVPFPAAPKVSPGAQQFIRDCLAYDQESRPTVHQLAEHDYLKPKPAKHNA